MNCAEWDERERAKLSSCPETLRFGDSLAGFLPFSWSLDVVEACEALRLVGLGGGEASVLYGDPGMGARGWPRSYASGETGDWLCRSPEADLRRACLGGLLELGLGCGELLDKWARLARVVD